MDNLVLSFVIITQIIMLIWIIVHSRDIVKIINFLNMLTKNQFRDWRAEKDNLDDDE
jgi:hypothetical protein